jgi:hypothetical protein
VEGSAKVGRVEERVESREKDKDREKKTVG